MSDHSVLSYVFFVLIYSNKLWYNI